MEKLKAIWYILKSKEYFILTERCVSISYMKDHPHPDIKLLFDIYKKGLKLC